MKEGVSDWTCLLPSRELVGSVTEVAVVVASGVDVVVASAVAVVVASVTEVVVVVALEVGVVATEADGVVASGVAVELLMPTSWQTRELLCRSRGRK